MEPVHLLFLAIASSITLTQLNLRLASPLLAVVNRWLRLGVFTGGGAAVWVVMEWSSRPYWVIVVVFCLLWILGESIYNWLAIKALSLSSLPLFPRFTLNPSGGEWPTQPRFLKLRDWLRSEGFKQVQALRAEVAPSVYLRVSVYQDVEANLRLQVTFLPQPSGGLSVCYSLSTHTVAGNRYVTDNLYLPFGGFYPENWLVERTPWRRSLKALVKQHRYRLAKSGEIVSPWTTEPLGDLNQQQQEMERLNTELGFLAPHADREEHGKISHEGRYRVWTEIFLLNYFSKSARYK